MLDEKDPLLWLEKVMGKRALAWVEDRNSESRGALAGGEAFATLQGRLLSILDSDDKIPYVGRGYGGLYYNFWKDADHERGILRCTTVEQYAQDAPQWETVLDIDALAVAEDENWFWAGSTGMTQDHPRRLYSLSRGGADATVVREFDMASRSFVVDGFGLPEAKHRVSFRDPDTLFVGTDFGPESLTTSGYPRIVKQWRRGTPLEAAETIYSGQPEDVSVGAYRDHTPGHERDFVYRMPSAFASHLWLLRDGELIAIDKPDSTTFNVWREWILLTCREPWTCGHRQLAAGTLVAAPFDDWLQGRREVEVLFEPTQRASLAGYSSLRSHLLLNVLDNVKSRIEVVTPGADKSSAWDRQALVGVPEFGAVDAWAVDACNSDAFFMMASGFLTPTALYRGEVGQARPHKLKQLPSFFDAGGLEVSQHEARSADGTRIPYFQVSSAELAHDGSHPTILYGYGGFELPMLPDYGSARGVGWLERGGVFVVANIRGGGEFGPAWHRAALRAQRPRAYEDFIAVGESLIERGVTSSSRLGVYGASNGGLLVGNMLTMRPDLFGAVVCMMPLLDMRRYHKLLAGASWMEEYGDPDDPEHWAFIRGFSPYHQVQPTADYPPVLFMTSTRDDRVHPGHARKMAEKMRLQGHDVTYYENVEGGHAGAANNSQSAFMSAMLYTFMWRMLGGADSSDSSAKDA